MQVSWQKSQFNKIFWKAITYFLETPFFKQNIKWFFLPVFCLQFKVSPVKSCSQVLSKIASRKNYTKVDHQRYSIMQRCSYKFRKIHIEVSFLIKLKLKSHFGMGVLLQIYCIFSKHLLLRKPLDGCFCNTVTAWKVSKYGVFSDPYFPAYGLNMEK